MAVYEIAFINVWWYSGGTDCRFFPTVEAQTAYFEEKAAGRWSEWTNVPFNDGIVRGTFRYRPATPEALYTALRANYCVIRQTADDGSKTYRYYFITASQLSGGLIEAEAELDDIQTNYVSFKSDISPCLIRRAHLDRWILGVGETVRFNNFPTSPLLTAEGKDTAKYLVERKGFVPHINTTNDGVNALNDAFDAAQPAWVEVFLKVQGAQKLGLVMSPFTIAGIDSNLAMIIAPITRNAWNFYSKEPSGNVLWDSSTLFAAFEKYDVSPYVANIKVSPVCPLPVADYSSSDYTVDTTTRTVVFDFSKTLWRVLGQTTEAPDAYFIANLKVSDPAPRFYDYALPFDTSFAISSVISGERKNDNPKLLSPNFREFRLVDYAGNSFSYDMQKINSDKVRILVTETPTSDLSKGYIRIEDSLGSVYGNGADSNYTGLTYSNDTSIPFSVEQIDAFLANNKNYALMQQSQRDYNTRVGNLEFGRTLSGGIVDLLSGAIGGGLASGKSDAGMFSILGGISSFAKSAVSAGIGLAKVDAQNALSLRQQNYTLDNMRSAPSDLRNAQGNVLFAMQAASKKNVGTALLLYVEIYESVSIDMEKIDDYMYMYGFSYDKMGALSDFDNIRNRFNYLEADIETMTAPISNEERERLKAVFKTGVRFWTSDTIDYTSVNPERRLLT